MTPKDRERRSRILFGIDRAREIARLTEREGSLQTMITEAPKELAKVRDRLKRLGGAPKL